MKRVAASVSLVSVLLLIGCGGSSHTSRPADVIAAAPSWYLNPVTEEDYLLGAGTGVSQDLQLSIRKAQTAARAQMAEQIEVRARSLNASFQEELGGEDPQLLDLFTSATRTIASQTLPQSQVRDQVVQQEDASYRAYVLMEVPLSQINIGLYDALRANEQAMTRVRATETFRELQQEAEEVENRQAKGRGQ